MNLHQGYFLSLALTSVWGRFGYASSQARRQPRGGRGNVTEPCLLSCCFSFGVSITGISAKRKPPAVSKNATSTIRWPFPLSPSGTVTWQRVPVRGLGRLLCQYPRCPLIPRHPSAYKPLNPRRKTTETYFLGGASAQCPLLFVTTSY